MAESKKRAGKRLQILKAAREVFARYGYDKTTLDDIGRRCGLNKASLYYYFKNKEEIFARVVLEEAAAFIGGLQDSTRRLEGTQAKLIHYITERLRYYGEVITLHQLSSESLQKVEPLFDQLYEFVKDKEIRFIASLLDEGMTAGELYTAQLEETAESVFLISDAFRHEAIRQANTTYGGEVDYPGLMEKVDFIIQLIFQGLKP